MNKKLIIPIIGTIISILAVAIAFTYVITYTYDCAKFTAEDACIKTDRCMCGWCNATMTCDKMHDESKCIGGWIDYENVETEGCAGISNPYYGLYLILFFIVVPIALAIIAALWIVFCCVMCCCGKKDRYSKV